jgi:hypothetical protein
MHRARREAIDEFLAHVGELQDDEARNLAEMTLNRAIETIALKRTWRDLQSPAPIELTLTVDQRSYALPDFFAKVGPGLIRNLSRRGLEITETTQEELQSYRPEAGTTFETAGAPDLLVIAGVCGVHTQPASTGDALEVVSDSAADISTKVKVSIEGDDANGRHRRREFTLNGLTPVAVGTWRWVDTFGKSYIAGQTPTTEYTSSAGSVILRKVTGAVELQYLFPEESSHEHRVITFSPKPATADVIAIPCIRRPKRLIYDGDPLPADWWPAIFEEMEAGWRSNTGEAGSAASLPRPALRDLVEWENTNGPRPRVRPYPNYVR